MSRASEIDYTLSTATLESVQPTNPVQAEYTRLADHRRAVADLAQRRFRTIGNLRLAAGLSAALLAFFVFGKTAVSPYWLSLPVTAFVVLVLVHARVVERLEYARRALRFYEQGLARVEGRWMGTGEQGVRFRDLNHVYSEDLDLFGQGSLYELLCTARTRAGEDALAKWLLAPASPDEVRARQTAVDELAPRLDVREQLALIGEDVRAGVHQNSLAIWGREEPVFFPAWAPVAAALLAAGAVVTLLAYLADFLDRLPVLLFVLAELAVTFAFRPRVKEVEHGVELPSHDLAILAQLLEKIENASASSPMLQAMKERLKTEGLPASRQIAKLERLATWLEWKHNQFFLPIAGILMWSLQLAVAIERWRKHSGMAIRTWIEVAGEFEALCALACYRHEHPSDPFPQLIPDGPLFEGRGLGHPLLASGQCVTNDVRLGPELPLLIISGSNMSGKSTLLRTIGLNTVLAWAGAPVRATELKLSRLKVGSSIRVQDSLQDGKSRFYAEITRLRQVVELTSEPPSVLFLLDELLSGTNSHDRRIGAAAIVKGLIDRGAIGLLTTHDLALAHIAESVQPPGVNMHFADTMENGQLHFDYRLMPGVVERSNALELMRSVGLPV